MTLQELREFLWESERGQVFDSLICVELGIQEYEAAWVAHSDMSTPEENHNDVIVRFLVDVADYIGVNDTDFEKVLQSTEAR
tara:strand:+ start:584 stop:829 length:246 start_codon:yes stop_codon:yes gene_type:complete